MRDETPDGAGLLSWNKQKQEPGRSRNMRLIDRLEEYGRSDFYGFHMPGHKRRQELGITSFPNPFSVDITEIEGFDNLHHAEGILRDSMEQAAQIYGSDRTYYLVNGSTCGILAAISAAVPEGGTILMARNSHKSAYHGVMLRGLKALYVYPEIFEEYGIQGGISAEKIDRILKEQGKREIGAVFLTSPTYEGIVSDVERIAETVHSYGLPLIVDQAHGAHLAFGEGTGKGRREGRLFARSALELGADVVIESVHKTLPSLTQTALLHIRGSRIDRECLEFYLRVYQSSSPSYLLMASIDNCIQYMDLEGRKRLEKYGRRLEQWMERAEEWKCLWILDDSVIGSKAAADRDLSKLVVGIRPHVRRELGEKTAEENGGRERYNGTWLAAEVRERFHLEPEMCCDRYVIFMTSLMDSEEGLLRLMEALCTIDRELCEKAAEENKREGTEESKREDEKGAELAAQDSRLFTWTRDTEVRMNMSEAIRRPGRRIRLEQAAGLVSRGFLTVYPPGVPAIVPGEEISREALQMILSNRRLGLTVEGIYEDVTVDTAVREAVEKNGKEGQMER